MAIISRSLRKKAALVCIALFSPSITARRKHSYSDFLEELDMI